MRAYTVAELRELQAEYLKTLEQNEEFQDGWYISDAGMAEQFISGFFEWLDEKEQLAQ